jgi:hypothetical protein
MQQVETFQILCSSDKVKLRSGLDVRFIHKRIFNAVFRLDCGFGLGKNQASSLVFGIGQYF